MFTSGFKEESASEITIDGIRSAEAFDVFLEYAYTGKLNVDKVATHMFDVLYSACYIQFTEFIERLREYAIHVFESQPEKVTACEAWKCSVLADNHAHMRCLREASLKYLDDNVEGLKKLDIFLRDSSVEFLEEFLGREYLSGHDEEKEVGMMRLRKSQGLGNLIGSN